MTRKLTIADNLKIDALRLVDSRMLIQANSGGGKSWLLRLVAEQAAGEVQTIILDPEGEFATLREKFDFLLVGPTGEIPCEMRSATLLARKLLELQASAVVDLYDLKLPERRRFVRLFLESLMHLPKPLWRPLFVMLDEAHLFCPEKSAGEAESTGAVIDLMSQGRKRSFCGILATQRLSKLHKDAEAETNNVFIGRSWLDIDQQRAGSLLGFDKADRGKLRDLSPGEFIAFGPALSVNGIARFQAAEVQTTHPKAGQRHKLTPPKPSEAVKRIVASLADLPQQADAEVRDMADARKRIADLERQVKAKPAAAPAVPNLQEINRQRQESFENGIQQGHNEAFYLMEKLQSQLDAMKSGIGEARRKMGLKKSKSHFHPKDENRPADAPPKHFSNHRCMTPAPSANGTVSDKMPTGERSILIACAQFNGRTRSQLTTLTGYKRSTRDAYIYRLTQAGRVSVNGDLIEATEDGIAALGSYEPLPTGEALQAYWLKNLPKGEADILAVLLEAGGNPVDRDTITERTGFKRSTRDAYLHRMSAKELIIEGRGEVAAAKELFE